MNIRKIVIENDGLDLAFELEKLNISQRKFAQYTPYRWYIINRIINGQSITENKAKIIRECLLKLREPNSKK